MWIYGNDGGNTAASGNGGTGERTPSKPASKPKAKGSSGASSRMSSGASGISEQPRSKRLKTAQAKTEAKG
eukprot:jgi/Undpi1/4496/HiC_scaffold_17.g07850.m1